MSIKPLTPFGADPPEELPLSEAPLKAVLVQVRFPQLATLRDPDVARTFPEKIAREYPILKEGKEIAYTLGPEGAIASEGSLVFQSSSLDGAWTVGLVATSLSIATTSYTSRVDLCHRLEFLIGNLQEVVGGPLPATERIGVRYINLLSDVDNIDHYLEPLLLTNRAFPQSAEEPVEIVQAISHLTFSGAGWSLQSRSGLLPSGMLLDASIEPTEEVSWVIDIDANTTEPIPMEPHEVGQASRRLAERIYHFFRWAVTETFLEKHGVRTES